MKDINKRRKKSRKPEPDPTLVFLIDGARKAIADCLSGEAKSELLPTCVYLAVHFFPIKQTDAASCRSISAMPIKNISRRWKRRKKHAIFSSLSLGCELVLSYIDSLNKKIIL